MANLYRCGSGSGGTEVIINGEKSNLKKIYLTNDVGIEESNLVSANCSDGNDLYYVEVVGDLNITYRIYKYVNNVKTQLFSTILHKSTSNRYGSTQYRALGSSSIIKDRKIYTVYVCISSLYADDYEDSSPIHQLVTFDIDNNTFEKVAITSVITYERPIILNSKYNGIVISFNGRNAKIVNGLMVDLPSSTASGAIQDCDIDQSTHYVGLTYNYSSNHCKLQNDLFTICGQFPLSVQNSYGVNIGGFYSVVGGSIASNVTTRNWYKWENDVWSSRKGVAFDLIADEAKGYAPFEYKGKNYIGGIYELKKQLLLESYEE